MTNPLTDIIGSLKRSESSTVQSMINIVRWLQGKRMALFIDFKFTPKQRWGGGLPAHHELDALLNRNRRKYLSLIDKFAKTCGLLEQVADTDHTDPNVPYWKNNWFSGLDAVALYNMPLINKSRTYIEIGSGFSTKWINKSRTDNSLDLKIISIDPHPRAEIDALCDELHRVPLEEMDTNFFSQLKAGDILMIDSSHRCFQNNDVTILFLEVIPRLPKGVIVHVHDIFLPYDYPKNWAQRYYSEQYLLAAMLLADASKRYDVMFPVNYINEDPELRKAYLGIWDEARDHSRYAGGGSFWLKIT